MDEDELIRLIDKEEVEEEDDTDYEFEHPPIYDYDEFISFGTQIY